MKRGSRTGAWSVYLVVKQPIIPNMMPIITPPKATTKKEVAPNKMSTGRMLSSPMSAKASNNLYNTLNKKVFYER